MRKVKLSGKRKERSNDEKTSLSIPIQKPLILTKYIQFQFSLPFPNVYISFLLLDEISLFLYKCQGFLYQNLIIQYIEFLSATFIPLHPSPINPFFCSFLNSFRSFFIDVIEHFNPIITRLNDVTIDNHDR